jgi:hypothetical protein
MASEQKVEHNQRKSRNATEHTQRKSPNATAAPARGVQSVRAPRRPGSASRILARGAPPGAIQTRDCRNAEKLPEPVGIPSFRSVNVRWNVDNRPVLPPTVEPRHRRQILRGWPLDRFAGLIERSTQLIRKYGITSVFLARFSDLSFLHCVCLPARARRPNGTFVSTAGFPLVTLAVAENFNG